MFSRGANIVKDVIPLICSVRMLIGNSSTKLSFDPQFFVIERKFPVK